MAYDSTLGSEIHKYLKDLGIETPLATKRLIGPNTSIGDAMEITSPSYVLEDSFKTVISVIGLDLNDDSIRDTPKRLAKMYLNEICHGLDYSNFPACTTVENKFKYDELVVVRDIEVKSLCEHHFMPIMGKATVAYIPHTKVLGLSKFNRIVEFFSRRPQVQERLTEQISATLRFILGTEDVAVIIAGEHYCVKFRGIEDMCSDTVTSKVSGRFRTKPELRAELTALINM